MGVLNASFRLVTFRLEHNLAETLRALPNQTKFVEDALRQALGMTCPTCHGEGRVPLRRLVVTNVRRRGIGRLNREEAVELQRVFRLGREVAATRLELRRRGECVGFNLVRDRAALMNGVLASSDTRQ